MGQGNDDLAAGTLHLTRQSIGGRILPSALL